MTGWLARLFGRAPAPSDAPLIYAVGDVHGRRDLLRELIDIIHEDREGRPTEVIFLGDYIDLGPDSSCVIDDLMRRRGMDGVKSLCLMGNHEATMLGFLDGEEKGLSWAEHGGLDTLASYGVRPPARRTDPAAWSETRAALAEAVPQEHLDFMRAMPMITRRGGYLFVHAGIDPKRPLDEQGEREFLWIRKPFHKAAKNLEFTVVHGHSANLKPVLTRDRICVDTGAYTTGELTAVRLGDKRPRFVSTKGRR
jgi:serine/threonine protein phosphatase 1